MEGHQGALQLVGPLRRAAIIGSVVAFCACVAMLSHTQSDSGGRYVLLSSFWVQTFRMEANENHQQHAQPGQLSDAGYLLRMEVNEVRVPAHSALKVIKYRQPVTITVAKTSKSALKNAHHAQDNSSRPPGDRALRPSVQTLDFRLYYFLK